MAPLTARGYNVPVSATDPLIGVSPALFVPVVRFGQVVKLTAGLVAIGLVVTGRATMLDLALLASTYFLTMLGITAGFHRLLTHGSFTARPWLKRTLVALGTMAGQGGPLIWVAIHREHHRFSDRPGDPHSPHACPAPAGSLKALWHAQLGWILKHYPAGLASYVPDLLSEPWIVRMNQRAGVWVHLGIALPGLIGWLATGTWQAVLSAMIFGGWARMFLVELSVSMVNSVAHVHGTRAFDTPDESRNHPVVAWLTLGEGWHNNHHAFPASARHGWGWGQLDVTWLCIRAWQQLGLADEVRLPDAARLAKRRVDEDEAA